MVITNTELAWNREMRNAGDPPLSSILSLAELKHMAAVVGAAAMDCDSAVGCCITNGRLGPYISSQ
jgi:hypothetical protein